MIEPSNQYLFLLDTKNRDRINKKNTTIPMYAGASTIG